MEGFYLFTLIKFIVNYVFVSSSNDDIVYHTTLKKSRHKNPFYVNTSTSKNKLFIIYFYL